jgi:hypothetical protein
MSTALSMNFTQRYYLVLLQDSETAKVDKLKSPNHQQRSTQENTWSSPYTVTLQDGF